MSYDPQNIFAKILRQEISAIPVYEDEQTLVIMDAMPQADGHVLIIPKTTARNILDIEPQILQHTILIVQKMAKATQQAFQADGITISQFNEEAGGQSVFHLHFHVIPRCLNKPLKQHSGVMADPQELEKFAQQIQAYL